MKKLAYILIISLAALTVAGIVIGSVVLNKQDGFEKDITLSEDGVTQEEMSINLEGIYPGKSVEYTIHFGGNAASIYDLELTFTPSENVALAQYMDVELDVNGETVSSGLLSEYLGGEAVALDLEIGEGGESTFVLRYTRPETVGNEAMNLTADFTINITATSKE